MAKSITKPAAIIICTGGTSGDPITMQEICDEDTTQGWGLATSYGNGFFQIAADLDIGDGSTPTHVTIQAGEAVDMVGFTPRVRANATLNMGEASNTDYGKSPAFLKFKAQKFNRCFVNGGTLNLYSASLYFDNQSIWMQNGTINTFRVTIGGAAWLSVILYNMTFDLEDIYLYTANGDIRGGSGTTKRIHSEASSGVGWSLAGLDGTVTDLLVTNSAQQDVNTGDAVTLTLKDPRWTIIQAEVNNDNAAGEVHVIYTCNIHIADKDGVNINGATIACEDQFGVAVFSVNTGATGDIIEQIIIYKKWVGTSETETEYSPHKFTISKAGYETMVLDAVTVDGKINWHLELLDELAEGDVRDGVAYGEDSEGNLELPAAGDVESGVGFGSNGVEFTGDFEVPPEADVRDGEGYGAGGAEFEGDLDLPAIGDVEKGVDYDGATKTGTFKSPAEADVRESEGYGAGDVEFTGTLDLPAEADVEDGVIFDGATKEGNFEAPVEADVEDGIGYGSNGAEFEGDLEIPAEEDVRDGEGYGAGGVEFTGELDLPSINDVEKGVQFDSLTKTGTFKSPAEPDVRDGEGYGANDIEFEGELDLPAEADVRDGTFFDSLTKEGLLDLPSINDVEDGVKYDNDTKEGNFEAPAEEDVEVGVGYGSLGTEFEGTYLGLKGNNLTAVLEKSVALTGHLEKKVSLTGELKS